MAQQASFSVQQSPIDRAFLRLLPWCLAGLAIPFLLGVTNITIFIETAIFVGVLIGGMYLYARRAKWVHMSPSGIQGYSRLGLKVNIEWSEPVTLGRHNFNGIECIAIRPASRSNELLLPMSIHSSMEFKSVLEELAPPHHPLLSVEPNAL